MEIVISIAGTGLTVDPSSGSDRPRKLFVYRLNKIKVKSSTKHLQKMFDYSYEHALRITCWTICRSSSEERARESSRTFFVNI